VGQRKFGGNAQAISKDRWLHHTSFLWDYEPDRMALLKQPSRAPEYRAGRDHSEFIVPLKQVFQGTVERTDLVDGLALCLEKEGFMMREGKLEEAEDALEKNTLIGSKLLDINDYL
jgi:lipoate-protein ligase A